MSDMFFRYMGREEYEALMDGRKLVNESRHVGANTNSAGFCFFKSRGDLDSDIVRSSSYTAEIVSEYVCVLFRNEGAQLKEGYGLYADPYGDFLDSMTVTEYSTTEYDKTSMVPVETKFEPFREWYDYED